LPSDAVAAKPDARVPRIPAGLAGTSNRWGGPFTGAIGFKLQKKVLYLVQNMDKVGMQQFVGISLKTRLYLLVLAAFIPVAVLIFYVAEEQKDIEKAAILQKTEALAQAAANEENLQLQSTRNLLAAVANAYLMSGDRTAKVSGLLAALMKQSQGYAAFGIVDPDGRWLAGSNPSGAGRDFGGTAWFTTCLKFKDLAMGQYNGDQIDGEPVLYFGLPALDGRGQVKAVAYAALDLNWMNRTIFKRLTELPKGSRLTLLDETEGMFRYDVDARRWSVPVSFDPALRRQIFRRRSGSLSATDADKVLRIYTFAPLASSFRNRRISVVLEIPQVLALAASKHIFTRNVALLVASALMAVLSIWWAGDVFILRRVRAMVQASRKLASGDLGVRIGRIGVRDELSHLAEVFDDMAAKLQMRIEREEQVMASLERSREQLRSLAAYQQEVREQERSRIAREIHDQFGQSLTILKMDLSWLKKLLAIPSPEVDEKMAAMARVIEEALKNLHAVTAELRPVILDDFGLAAAIEWQVEEFRERSGIACRMESNGFEPDLPKDQAAALFRIFQETLTNIMRHARADDVLVRLAAHEGDVLLEVRDNGRGITAAEIDDPKSFGLLGMRERLYPWNGRVTFEGRPGEGTCVTVRLPMSPKGERQ
jgi:signal transduction histidine kinase